MSYALSITLDTTFDDAVERTRNALADQGFGVLTEIDMKATLKAKLDEDMEDYLIFGACNPPLAHRALECDRRIGLLLPCNVAVRADPADPSKVIIDAMDPEVMVGSPMNQVYAKSPTTLRKNCAPQSRPSRAKRRRVIAVNTMTVALALGFGAVIGVLLGLLGGGGSIMAVPVLVYALGLDIEQAILIALIVISVPRCSARSRRRGRGRWNGGWRDIRCSRHPGDLRRIGCRRPSLTGTDHDRLRSGDGCRRHPDAD